VSDLPPPPEAEPAPPPALPATRRQWPTFAVLVVALLVAVGAAILGWLRPGAANPAATPTYSGQQVAAAKAKVCAAYDRVHHAVLANTGRDGGTDPAMLLGVAANARIALFDSGEYLEKVLTQAPATPTDLADATRALANAYQELALDYMAEATEPDVQSASQLIEKTGSTVQEKCK
jgi:hypothetical protein